jgi:hypothetical protein
MGITERAYNIASNLPARYEHDNESFSSHDGLLESASLEDDDGETFDLQDYDPATKPSWILRRFPKVVQSALLTTWDWTKGPNPPRMWKIEPVFPSVNTAPLQLLDTYLPNTAHRFWLYVAFCTLWLLSFTIILRAYENYLWLHVLGSEERLWHEWPRVSAFQQLHACFSMSCELSSQLGA